MAFSRKKRKFIKYFFIIFMIIGGVSSCLYGGYYFYNYHINKIVSGYEEEIETLKLEKYMNKRVAVIPLEDIENGNLLSEESFEVKELYSTVSQDFYMSEEDFGKIAKIDLQQGMPVMKNMINDEEIPDDIREEEFNMFFLSSNLRKGIFIDLRINFPNGEDYIVLSKKKIRNLDKENNTLWLWLTEQEILRVSSSIVDAYMHKGTKLYTVVYVEPTIQKEAEVTYPANIDVLKIMETNPNILEDAKTQLTKEVRNKLDERLEKIEEEHISSVEANVNKEQSTRQQIIQDEVDKQNSATEVVDEEEEPLVTNNADSKSSEADNNGEKPEGWEN